MVSQEFILKVSKIRHDKKALLDLLNDIDAEKRSIKSAKRKWSTLIEKDGGLTGNDRIKKLNRILDKESFLIEEREYVRNRIGDLNKTSKSLKRIANEKKAGFVHAFMVACEQTLSEDLYIEIEQRASQILTLKR